MDNDPENQLKKKEIQQKLENFKIKNVKQIDDLIYEHGYDIEIGYEKRSLLHYACIVEFDAELVELLVKEGVDVNKKDFDRNTPIHFACSRNEPNLDLIQLLIKLGAEIGAINFKHETPLILACSHHYPKNIIEFLIKNGADVNKSTQSHKFPFHLLLEKNTDIETLKLFLDQNIDINCVNQELQNSLHIAIRKNPEYNIVKFLLENGFKVNHLDSKSKTPLHYAIQSNLDVSIIELLAEFGADFEFQDGNSFTPFDYVFSPNLTLDYLKKILQILQNRNLFQKIMEGNHLKNAISGNASDEVIKYLTNLGFSLKNDPETEISLVKSAISNPNKFHIVKNFITENSINYRDPNMGTLLHLACMKKNNSELIKFLVSKGIDINYTNHGRKSLALSHAFYNDYEDSIIEILFNHETDVNSQISRRSKPPLHILCEKRRSISLIKKMVTASKCDINFQDYKGKTALHLAFLSTSEEIESEDQEESLFFPEIDGDDNQDDNDIQNIFSQDNIQDSYRCQLIDLLIENGASLSVFDYTRKSPLHYLQFGNKEIQLVKLLSEKKINWNICDEMSRTPLHYACYLDNLPIALLEILLQNGAKINLGDKKKKTPLYIACSKTQNYDIISTLIQNGANVNAANLNGKTPLFAASGKRNNLRIMQLLLSSGSKIEATDSAKNTILHYACSKNIETETIELLINSGCSVSALNSRSDTVLHVACNSACFLSTIKLLISKGVDVNSVNISNETALNRACQKKSGQEIIQFLLDSGADANIKDSSKLTPFYYACSQGCDSETIKTLIRHTEDISIRDYSKNTPLHLLCQKMTSDDVIQALIDKGADVNALNNNSETPLYLACSRTLCSFTAGILLKNGANPRIKSKQWHLPITKSIGLGDVQTIKKLLKFDSDNNVKIAYCHPYIAQLLNKFYSIQHNLESMVDFEILSDITFHCLDGDVHLNRVILDLRLAEDLNENLNSKETIYDKLAEVFFSKICDDVIFFMKFLYSGFIPFEDYDEDLQKIYSFANEIGLSNSWVDSKKGYLHLIQDLSILYKNEKSKDFQINIGEKAIKTHKIILAARSGLYRAMFECANEDKSNSVTDYSGKSIESIEKMIEFFYFDKIDSNIPIEIFEEMEEFNEFYRLEETIFSLRILDWKEKYALKFQ